MRDRLIELVNQINFDYCEECVCASEDGYKGAPDLAEFFADRLLSEGVIVPPCKVGQTVYVTDILIGKICECEVISVTGFAGEENTLIEYEAPKEITSVVSYESCDTEIGISIFLTREEAERALKEAKNGT